MYQKILVTLDTTASDAALLEHIVPLATLLKSEILLLHVADGWVARNYDQLNLADSEEMQADLKYLEEVAARLRAESGLEVTTHLALGSPPAQILKVVETEKVDLIAMASHGHRLIGDIIHGSTIDVVRHGAQVPLWVIPAKKS